MAKRSTSRLDKLIQKKPSPVPNKKQAKRKSDVDEIKIPADGDWRTTDEDEINRRRLRAREEPMKAKNLTPDHPVFSDFQVSSASVQTYTVQIHDVMQRHFACSCMDFRINGLGTCKHVEAVLWQLQKRLGKAWQATIEQGSSRTEIMRHRSLPTLILGGQRKRLPAKVKSLFGKDDGLSAEFTPEEAFDILAPLNGVSLRVSLVIPRWLETRRHADERVTLRRAYEQSVVQGEAPSQVTLMPLYPYQRDGMLHLAFTGRAMLADEMGLGKTIQAIAACALLHRLGKAKRVLVISPASLKTEWEEQIRKFTTLDYQIVYGGRRERAKHYTLDAPMFTLMNYEQVRSDVLDINQRLAPDIVVLDEAQRIKNWASNTARAIKMLRSPFAFVLTGTPLENRIDELYSLVDFLDPEIFGSLFRFNRDFYSLDEKGRPDAYHNLRELHERVRPLMLRRRKSDVEDELPERTDENRFVPMSEEQAAAYDEPMREAAQLASIAKRRPLRKQEHERLMMNLAKMRMICDSVYILDSEAKECPKIGELRSILEDCLDEPEVKIIIFSEWVRMLELVQRLLKEMKIGYALHTGQVSQKRRRAEIISFKKDPNCRILLCTESGGSGLNLQNASVVINCDLPWNPAKLEQRIARAWRKHQKRAVTVINLVTEKSIEHGMLETLAMKQGLSDGVLDLRGNLDRINLKGGGQSFMNRLQVILTAAPEKTAERPPLAPIDRPQALATLCQQLLGQHLLSCEERFATEASGSTIAIVVDRDADSWRPRLEALHHKLFTDSNSVEPTRLVVLDRATVTALEALQAAGLIQRSERARRPLDGSEPTALTPLGLTDAEKQHIADIKPKLNHRLKVAKALIAAELREDACAPLSEALCHACEILSVKNRVSPPKSKDDTVIHPWIQLWSAPIREALRNSALDTDAIQQSLLISECEQMLHA
ncbi:hypothetical protein BH11VER1_BH11VER1_30870 [soil metagenome]